MKITQDVRDYAATLNDKEAGLPAEAQRAEAEAGMKEMSKKFLDLDAQVYVDKDKAAKEANKAL